jgi:GNAT superfamily N-acetyltransferase
MSQIVVRKVETKADKKRYFEYPWVLYKDCPYWVPPLKSIRRHLLDTAHDASWEYMEGEFFLAERDGQTAGTITAFVNHRHNQTWNQNIGWFGDFNFIDDPEVARALLAKAEEWVKGRGCTAIRGPATFTFHAELGVRMEDYEDLPTILLPYNYDYYPRHIEAAGYRKEMDLYNWRAATGKLIAEENPQLQKYLRVVEKNNQKRKIEIRLGDPKNKNEDFALIQELYNTAWKDNWGFVPLTQRELESMVKDLKSFYEPSMTFYAYVDGQRAGFLLGLPDLNQALIRGYPRPGKPEIISLLQTFWHWKIRRKINRVRVPLMGIKEEYRQIGVDGAMFLAGLMRAMEVNYDFMDGGWILETNQGANQICKNLGAHMYCRYRIYQKDFVS